MVNPLKAGQQSAANQQPAPDQKLLALDQQKEQRAAAIVDDAMDVQIPEPSSPVTRKEEEKQEKSVDEKQTRIRIPC
jgi:hypothetical protein